MKPTVDVIVPCYNYGPLLDACVSSVLSQQGVVLRVLILDDCSTDTTEVAGRALASRDARVEFRRHAINQGHIATYNEGLEWSSAEYSLLLSADDMLTPGSLARATKLMDAHPDVSLAYGRDVPFHSAAPPLLDVSPGADCECTIFSYPEFLDIACGLGMTPIHTPTAVARLSVHRTAGWYRPEHPHSGDTEVWLRLAAQGAVGFVDADQAFRRIHGSNMSFGYSLLQRLKEHKKAFDTHFDEFGARLPDLDRLRRKVHAAFADQAFWLGSRAFDEGDAATCAECMNFAAAIHPSIREAASWSRLQWKRRLGPAAWKYVRPLRDMLRPESRQAS